MMTGVHSKFLLANFVFFYFILRSILFVFLVFVIRISRYSWKLLKLLVGHR